MKRKLINSIMIFLACCFSMAVEAQIFNSVNDWRYVPYREDFWNEFSQKLEAKDYNAAFSLAVNEFNPTVNSPEGLESRVALAEVCLEIGEFTCSYIMAYEVIKNAPTSIQAGESLIVMQTLVQNGSADEEELSRLINSAAFSRVPPKVESMVNYYSLLDNYQKGLLKWAGQNQNKIDLKSYWGLRLSYLNTLKLIEGHQVEKSIQELTRLALEAEPYPKLKKEMMLQKARLLFEEKRYDEADAIYSLNEFEGREYGRALYERSWTKYYQKDFSTTLGILEALKAPYFQVAVNPEQYVLSMIAYRDLCHYPSVKEIASEFNNVFEESLNNIKNRKALTKDVVLMRMVLQQADLQQLADLVSNLYSNRNAPKGLLKQFSSNLDPLWNSMEKYEKELRGRVEHRIQRRLIEAAETLLNVADQIKIVDYVSGLDEFRLKQVFEKRNYKAKSIEYYAIDQLYWPVKKEFWWEEMGHYQTRINDRCSEAKQ